LQPLDFRPYGEYGINCNDSSVVVHDLIDNSDSVASLQTNGYATNPKGKTNIGA